MERAALTELGQKQSALLDVLGHILLSSLSADRSSLP
jgi:hypothetical protein